MMTQYAIQASAELYQKLRDADKRINDIRAARKFGVWAKNSVHGLVATIEATDDVEIRNLLLRRATKDRDDICRRLRQHNAPVPDLILTKVD